VAVKTGRGMGGGSEVTWGGLRDRSMVRGGKCEEKGAGSNFRHFLVILLNGGQNRLPERGFLTGCK